MGIALRSRRHRRQHSIVSVQEIDLSQVFYREFRVVFLQNMGLHFCKDPRQFYSSWTCTCYNKGQVTLAMNGIFHPRCPIETRKDHVAQGKRIANGLHRKAVLGNILVSEIIGFRSCC